MNKKNPLTHVTNWVFVLLILTTLHVQAQQKEIDNALLWKITGKSLPKPSFLFGTIHLQDKRVFNFNDSLYSFIRSADGFAMEVHPDSVLSALMQKVDDEASDKLLKRHLRKDEFNQLSRQLKKEGIDANRLTLREAYLLRDRLNKPEPRADDMPTFVDAYLFGMARNQGKEIVGLEKATDQVNLLEDIRGEFDVKELLKNMKKEKTLTERMIQLYMREDLRAIQKLMSYLPEETEDKLLTMRNLLMVARMDSLIQSKSFVVAVGTAHLPGEKGMIELLRQKGYTVEPVFTTSRTHANNYAVKAEQKMVWVDIKEPKLGYSARMPGKPNPMDMLNGSMKMNMYMDLTSMKVYYTAYVVPATTVTAKNVDSILQSMSKNAMSSSRGEVISTKRFTKDKFEGIDFVYRQATDKMYARVQALAMGKRVYLIGFGSPRQEDLQAKEAGEFFSSFTLENMPEQTWEVHTFKEHHFNVSLPSAPKISKVPFTDSSVTSMLFNSIDSEKGAYFAVSVVTTNPGYVVPNDSAYFASSIQRLKDAMTIEQLQEKDTLFAGFSSRHIKAVLKDGLRMNCVMINRGNRVYNLMSITNAEDSAYEAVPQFLSSFSFIDYPQMKWQVKKMEEYAFIAPVPGEYTKVTFLDEDEDSLASQREYQWLTYDSATATSFFVTHQRLSPYLWARHDTVLLKRYMKDLPEEGETVTDYRFIRNGNVNGIEYNVARKNSNLSQRVRILLNGTELYVLQTDAPKEYWKKYNYHQFLEGFRFAKESGAGFIQANSFNRLLKDLASSDSAIQSNAYDAIDDVIFDSTDIPALLQAATTEYALDTLHYYTSGNKMMDVLEDLKHPDYVKLVTDHYNQLKPSQEQFRYDLLHLLAAHKTQESYTALGKLLRQGLPAKGHVSNFVVSLGDSLLLTKNLYPYLFTLSGDTLLGTPLLGVHKQMLDSNIISLDEFRAHTPQLLKTANNELLKISANKEDSYYAQGIYSLPQVLGALGTDSAFAMIRRLMNAGPVNIKYIMAFELLRKKKPVDAATWMAIAQKKTYRVDLYNELREMKLERIFPSKYLTQKAFAESYLCAAMEDEGDEREFVGERTVVFRGKKQKFYLFKYTLEEEGKRTLYLAIGGPFSMDGKTVYADNDASGVYWEEEFKQSAIDKHLKAYLAEYEKEEMDLPPLMKD